MNNNQSTINQYSTTQLLTRPFDDQLEFDENEKIKDEFKWKINNSTLNIQSSKFIGKPDDKFETMLFLPETEDRKGEGGLRTKGYFKFSYKKLMFNDECLILNDKDGNEFKVDNSKFKIQNSKLGKTDTNTSHLTSNNNSWWITDSDNKPIKPAPPEIQQKINQYTTNQYTNNQSTNPTFNIQHSQLDKLPLISIITVVFNGEKYLEKTILSVINQTYPNVEYIIIDGGSTDGTLDIIKKYEHAIDYWVSEPDKGIYDAMNKGIKLVIGDFIGILNADDYYERNFLNQSINCIVKNGVDYSIANVKFADEKSIIRPIYPLKKNYIYQEMPYPHVGALISKKAYKTVGFFDTRFKIAGDHDMALRIHMAGFEGGYLDTLAAFLNKVGVSAGIESTKESCFVAIKNGKPLLIAYITYFKQLINIALYKILPSSVSKKIQKIKKSRFR